MKACPAQSSSFVSNSCVLLRRRHNGPHHDSAGRRRGLRRARRVRLVRRRRLRLWRGRRRRHGRPERLWKVGDLARTRHGDSALEGVAGGGARRTPGGARGCEHWARRAALAGERGCGRRGSQGAQGQQQGEGVTQGQEGGSRGRGGGGCGRGRGRGGGGGDAQRGQREHLHRAQALQAAPEGDLRTRLRGADAHPGSRAAARAARAGRVRLGGDRFGQDRRLFAARARAPPAPSAARGGDSGARPLPRP